MCSQAGLAHLNCMDSFQVLQEHMVGTGNTLVFVAARTTKEVDFFVKGGILLQPWGLTGRVSTEEVTLAASLHPHQTLLGDRPLRDLNIRVQPNAPGPCRTE